MNGDLLKSASRVALVAVAGLFAGSVAAQAADLGGNCCADLEERVAELEATTARKGNRKVSLTVYGQVNEAVMFWNDGQERNAYVNTNNASRTRFGFRGDAKVTSDISLGYNLEIGSRYSNSQGRNQTAAGAAGGNNSNSSGLSAPGPLDIRQQFWYVDSKSLGRVSVGKQNTAIEGITEINLANVNATAFDVNNTNGGFFLRNSGTNRSALTWAMIQSQQGSNIDGDRSNVVKYTSPTFAGFIASASWGDDDKKDIALRYAGEFSGFRLAAGIGYQVMTDFNPTGDGASAMCSNPGGAEAAAAAGAVTPATVRSSVVRLASCTSQPVSS
jgi:predicted porin